jgi:hypothetical protein
MDPQDPLIQRHDGASCAVCGESVAPDDVRLLARRDDLAFLQIRCGCGSTTLAFVVAGAHEATGTGGDRAASSPAVTSDDVLDMHALLDGWTGDLRALLDQATRSGQRG